MTAIALQHPASRPLASKIIAVASGKGGVGKTWLSVSLAHALARANRRVLLLDADLGLANVDVQLGIAPAHDLGEALAGKIALNQAVTPHGAGFDVLAGRSGSGALAALPVAKLGELRDRLCLLSNRYDVTIMDLGAGIEPPVRVLSEGARACLVVTTDEPTALTDAYAFIKLCVGAGLSMHIDVVVNQSPSLREGEKTHTLLSKACANFLRLLPPLLGVIRKDGKVRESIRRQTSVVTLAPHCTAASDAASIAIKLLQK